jgi:hypothetical protein
MSVESGSMDMDEGIGAGGAEVERDDETEDGR